MDAEWITWAPEEVEWEVAAAWVVPEEWAWVVAQELEEAAVAVWVALEWEDAAVEWAALEWAAAWGVVVVVVVVWEQGEILRVERVALWAAHQTQNAAEDFKRTFCTEVSHFVLNVK